MAKPTDLSQLVTQLFVDSTGRFLIGDTATDLLGVSAGSVTISTGNSGLTAPNGGADDLIVESAGDTGITIASPNTAEGALRFGDPEASFAGSIVYDHATNAMEFKVNGGTKALAIDSSRRILTNTTDALGAEAGSVTISTGNSGTAATFSGADDFIIENNGSAGMTILAPDSGASAIAMSSPGSTSGAYLSWQYGTAGATQELGIGATSAAGKIAFFTGGSNRVGELNASGQFKVTSNNVTPIRAYRQNVGNLAGPKTGPIFYWDESDDLASAMALYFRGDIDSATQPVISLNTAGGPALGLAPSTDGASNDGILMNETNIIFGDWSTDALGAETGSVTISTGDSGVSIAPNTIGDDLIIENGSSAGITIATPNNGLCGIYFADPQDNDVGYIQYSHSANAYTIRANAALVQYMDTSRTTMYQDFRLYGDLTELGYGLTTQTCQLNLGANRTSNGASMINFDTNTTYTYGMRINRSSGPNGVADIQHRGLGDLSISCLEAAAIVFDTTSIERFRIESDGTLSSSNTTYETLVTSDDDIPNKKYVDDAVTAGGGITDIVNDTTPQLGGSLDVNGNSIVSLSNADVVIVPNGTGAISVAGTTNYETNVTADDDIPNKKYVDDAIGGYQLESTTSITGSPTSVSWAIQSLLSTYRQVLVIVEGLSYGSASFDNVELWSDAGTGTAFMLSTLNTSASNTDRDTFTFVWNKLPSNGTKTSYGVDMFWVAEDSSDTLASFIDKGYYQLDTNGSHSVEVRIDGGAYFAGGTIYIYGLV